MTDTRADVLITRPAPHADEILTPAALAFVAQRIRGGGSVALAALDD